MEVVDVAAVTAAVTAVVISWAGRFDYLKFLLFEPLLLIFSQKELSWQVRSDPISLVCVRPIG